MAYLENEGIRPYTPVKKREKGTGPNSAGQSGDTQGLSDVEDVSGMSVEELAEEAQGLEAGMIQGVEDAADSEGGEVKIKEVPEDDVPPEYDTNIKDETK